MKNKNKIVLSLMSIIVFCSIFIQSASAITTLGDSSFGFNTNVTLIYRVSDSSVSNLIGNKYRITIESIQSNGTNLNVEGSIDSYSHLSRQWSVLFSTGLMMGYNKTTNYLFINMTMFFDTPLCFVPYPVNLSLVNETMYSYEQIIVAGSDKVNTTSTYSGNVFNLTMNHYEGGPPWSSPPSVYDSSITFNEYGIAQSIYLTLSVNYLNYVLESISIDGIPFGNIFLLFSAIAVIALILIVRKRRILVKQEE